MVLLVIPIDDPQGKFVSGIKSRKRHVQNLFAGHIWRSMAGLNTKDPVRAAACK